MQKTLLTIFLLLFLAAPVFSQELSERHKRKLDKINDPEKREQLLKKYWKKDSAKYQRRLHRELKNATDKYLPVTLDSAIIEKSKKEAMDQGGNILEEKAGVNISGMDSTAVRSALEEKATQELKDQAGIEIPRIVIDSTTFTLDSAKIDQIENFANQKLREELGADIPDLAIDSTTFQLDSAEYKQLEKMATEKLEEKLMEREEFQQLKSVEGDGDFSKFLTEGQELDKEMQGLSNTVKDARELKAQKALKKQMTSRAKDYIVNNADKVQQVQDKMTGLKKKYDFVPNSNDLSTATKRNSLQGEPLSKRLVLGGNFSIGKTHPVALDLSPVVGYRINKNFEIGTTFIWRTSFEVENRSVRQLDDRTYGYSVFVDHDVYHNFFGHIEGERFKTTTIYPDESVARGWQETLLIGVGRKFSVASKFEMQALILFNVLHDNIESPYDMPIVFKTGFRIKK